LLSERDMVGAGGVFNHAAILRVAWMRAHSERDRDVLIAAFGPTLQLPAGVGQHNATQWRRERAATVDRRQLRLTPFATLLALELRHAWKLAHALRAANRRARETSGVTQSPHRRARAAGAGS